MYALTFCYEGCDDNYPYASTLAVSEDKDVLVAEMNRLVEEDLREPDEEFDEDEWSEDCNWQIYKSYGDVVMLQHKARTNLYSKYHISKVDVI